MTPQTGNPQPQQVRASRAHTCQTDDGVHLRGLLWQCPTARAIAIIRTPYNAVEHASTALALNSRGFHCLVQDVRGRYQSDGHWHPYHHEAADGLATLQAIAAQYPHLPIVLFGSSYAAHTALETAYAASASPRTSPPAAIMTLVPALGLAETAWDQHGAPEIRNRIGWWHQHGRTRQAQIALSPAELSQREADVAELGMVEAARSWGWDDNCIDAWAQLWTADHLDLNARYAHLHMPLLVLSGTEDFFDHHARRLASAWAGQSHFATGPWGHQLVAGVPDPAVRHAIQAEGGPGHLMDLWLAAHGFSNSPTPLSEIISTYRQTQSWFDLSDATWHFGPLTTPPPPLPRLQLDAVPGLHHPPNRVATEPVSYSRTPSSELETLR
ncbi:CocE/NonD family hydrolase [Devriesea agamarum]|uniref:CocE/NonD family hydrolase n=1 Tax=Devriesea agamarum TaxID=472569 RepID=UPI000A07A4EB|nr:CocE/NonD family hydrolase [Devriesea agamarum]